MELLQQTDEWLEFRRTKIGSSDAPIIMEVSPWKTPYLLWEEKILGRSNEASWWMKRGIELEEKARETFENLTGILVTPKVICHTQYDWMIASLDGIDIDGKIVVEIKCPGKEDHFLAMKNQIPEKYYPQLQHQIEVCGIDFINYFSFDGERGVLIEVPRDDKYIKKMLQKEKLFYECIQQLVPPEQTDNDFDFRSDDIWKNAANEWILLNEKLKEIEKKEESLRNFLIEMANKKNSRGAGIKVSKVIRKGNVNYSIIPELKEIDIEKYRKGPIECWKIIKE